MNVVWRYTIGNDEFGPSSVPEMAALVIQGKIKGGTLVWKEGMKNWVPFVESDLRAQIDAFMAKSEASLPAGEPHTAPAGLTVSQQEVRSSRNGQDVVLSGELEQTVKSGARWFYWIALLTFVNLVLAEFKFPISSAFGLGCTRLLYLIIPKDGDIPSVIDHHTAVVVLDLVLASLLCFFGWLAANGNRKVFIMGTVIVIADTILLVMPPLSIGGFGVRVYAVVCMYFGISALTRLKKIREDKSFDES